MPELEYDVVIVGAGVVGLSVARELLRREVTVLVLEKNHDVGRGASGRNSGVLHPGFSVAPGSLKAALNVEGSRLMRDVCSALGVALHEVGTLVVAASENEESDLHKKLAVGLANGVTDLRIVGSTELQALEPTVWGSSALYSPSGAILDPRMLVVRLAENVLANDGTIELETEVIGVEREKGRAGSGHWRIVTNGGAYDARVVVNAAGVCAPDISRMAGAELYASFPCRGEYLILDRLATGVPGRMVYPVTPESGGLGVHFTPTTEGNTLIGPSAEYISDGEDYATSAAVLRQLFEEAALLCPTFDPASVIAAFSGVRSKISRGTYGEADFVVQASDRVPSFVNLVGIESPGLTAAPAIARRAADLVSAWLPDRPERSDFVSTARHRQPFSQLTNPERRERARAEEESRVIVCRCEQVAASEVHDALNNPLGVKTLSAVKARCRAGSGRCQGAFCTPRIVDILRHECGVPAEQIRLGSAGSELLIGEAKVLFE
jgi:glycerol-3-phosphate dehydrogenase